MTKDLWQNEYLSLILILPYLVMAISRLGGVKSTRNEFILFSLIAILGIWIQPIFIFILIFFEFIGLSVKSHLNRINHRGLMVIMVGVIALSGFFLQLTTYLTIDIAWILDSTKRLVDGGVFGRDIIDCNPPLIWYLSYPVVFLSKITGLHSANVFHFTIIIVALLILLWMTSVVKRISSGINTPVSANVLLLAATYVFFVISGGDWGQREYIALLLSLPYMAMTAARLHGFKSKRKEAILVGITVGVGLALKPYFLAILFAVEFVVYIMERRLSSLLRPEVVVGVMTVITYWLIVLIFAPAYVFEVAPLALKSYWALDLSYSVMLGFLKASFMGLIVSALLCQRLSTTPISPILIAMGFGFTASFLIQKKGFSHHQFPIHALAIIALTVLIVEESSGVRL